MDGTKLNNPKDPLRRVEEASRELFKTYGKVSNGFSNEAVIDAAANLLVNVLRQTYPRRDQADARFSELSGKLRGILLDHYDPVTGKRRNIFPFTQHILPLRVEDPDKVKDPGRVN